VSLVAPSPARRTRPSRSPSRVNQFDLYAWFYLRVSGVFLLFLVFGHVLIMHLLNDITAINYTFVAQRWEAPFWRTYDWLMLTLALSHGFFGLRTLIDDYVHRPGWRAVSMGVLTVFGATFLLIGSWVILTFRPV
jgi:succinate dehydrogenase / fumarate reductase membrane anchor subunit